MQADSSRTIVLVEDNDDDVFVFQRALRKANLDNPVKVLTDGDAAVEYLATLRHAAGTGEMPCMIFLDLKLPKRDGFEILEWLRQEPVLRDLAVVILSGSDEPRDRDRARSLLARAYLVKPLNRERLLETLAVCVGPVQA